MSRDLNISQKVLEVKGGISRGFTKVPNRIFELALSDGAKLTLQHLIKRDFGKGYVWASARGLACERRRSVRSIRRHLRELRAKGFISVHTASTKRIFIHYERLGRSFLKVPNALFFMELSDGAKLTLEVLLHQGYKGRMRVTIGELRRARGKAERTIWYHLSELAAAGLLQGCLLNLSLRALRLGALDCTSAATEVAPQGAKNVAAGVQKMSPAGTKIALQSAKNVPPAKPKNCEKPDQIIHSAKSPFAEEDYTTKTKYIIYDDYRSISYSGSSIRHPVLRAFVEKEGRRLHILIKKFGQELVTRALRQADLQYMHSPTEIRNVFGLLFAMLSHGLDDTLLLEKEREEAERRRREQERLLRQEREDRLFRHLCEHPELWMERYVATRGRLEQLRASCNGDLARVIAEQYGGAIRRFVIPDLEGLYEDGGWA